MERRDLSGQVLDDRYRVIGPVGKGNMGSVYRAEDLKLGRVVAVKVINEHVPHEMAARQRFAREAKAMAKLEHPHCASVLDVGMNGDRPFVVMDFVNGKGLDEVVAEGPLPVARAVEVTRQILFGLAHAHEVGIIHRDIKPANIVLSQKSGMGDHAMILDFGLAKLNQESSGGANLTSGVVVGTPSYMAPEQIRGLLIDSRVDIYACGVLLYELLTGVKPFRVANNEPLAICMQHLNQPPPRLADVAGGDFGALEAVVAQALAKDRDHRFASATAFANALAAAVPAARPTPRPSTPNPMPAATKSEPTSALSMAEIEIQPAASAVATKALKTADVARADVSDVATAGDANTPAPGVAAAPARMTVQGIATPRTNTPTVQGIAAAGGARTNTPPAGVAREARTSTPPAGVAQVDVHTNTPASGIAAAVRARTPAAGVPTRPSADDVVRLQVGSGDDVVRLHVGPGSSDSDGTDPSNDVPSNDVRPQKPRVAADARRGVSDIAAMSLADTAVARLDRSPTPSTGFEPIERRPSRAWLVLVVVLLLGAGVTVAVIMMRDGANTKIAKTEPSRDAKSDNTATLDATPDKTPDNANPDKPPDQPDKPPDQIDNTTPDKPGPDTPTPGDEAVVATLAQADKLVSTGRREAAIAMLVKARKSHPTDGRLPYRAGLLYMDKMWWPDGIKQLRAAIELDPSYKTDAKLIQAAVKAFNSTAWVDWALSGFLRNDIGPAVKPYLEEQAKTHPNPVVRQRDAAEARRYP